MTGDTYPISNSLAHKVCSELMTLRAGSCLTVIDIAERFNMRSSEVIPLLNGAVQHGWLKRERVTGGPVNLAAYKAGPALIEMAEKAARAAAAPPAPAPAEPPPAAPTPPPPAPASVVTEERPPNVNPPAPAARPPVPAAPPSTRRTRRLPPIDPASLVIEYDKPVVPHAGHGRTSYAPVFDKLDRVGASTAAELRYMAALKQAAKHYVAHHAPDAKFAVRLDPDNAELCRVHRLA